MNAFKEDDFVLHFSKREIEMLKYTLEYAIEEFKDHDDALDYFSLRQELLRWYSNICNVLGHDTKRTVTLEEAERVSKE
jgi:hypothetical protein